MFIRTPILLLIVLVYNTVATPYGSEFEIIPSRAIAEFSMGFDVDSFNRSIVSLDSSEEEVEQEQDGRNKEQGRINQGVPEIFSAPGCPQPEETQHDGFYPFVKYAKNGRCYKVFTEGPCPPEMLFFIDPNNPSQGYCDCACFKLLNGIWMTEDTCSLYCDFKMARHPIDGRCYALELDQGPCNTGEWLVYKNNTTPYTLSCEPRQCPEGETIDFSNRCKPASRESRCSVGSSGSPLSLRCRSNQFYSYIQRRCVPKMARFTKAQRLRI